MTEFAYNLLRTLRVSSISSVYDRLWPMFHKDPLLVFPAEIMSQIFSYLEPSMLLEASRASKAWRSRILDSGLWKEKFRKEGWYLDLGEIEHWENSYNQKMRSAKVGKTNTRTREDPLRWTRRSTGQKPTPFALGNERLGTPSSTSTKASWRQSSPESGHPTPQNEQAVDVDEEMIDAEDEGIGRTMPREPQTSCLTRSSPGNIGQQRVRSSSAEFEKGSNASEDSGDQDVHLEQPLMIYYSPGRSHVNYQYIFKQKSKLEENWNSGRYKSFQLPHRDHPDDAHTECVYTIQYRGNYLVSGSRDRTLRIWNLETQRLAWKPLKGHVGSVLCLQFDDRKEEDIIISGSSDTHVIIWRFSTGEMLQQLTNAHRESVLNLKFDHRFLVTCSKDKTIKIWNRHEIRPGDKNYPLKGIRNGGICPSYIIDMPTTGGSPLRYIPTSPEHKMLLQPYTHLMSLDQHGAAVNAIQIYKNQLVSASGDRNLRVWDIHSGECLTRIEAHSKGIACVQYDGKRIVSGSSDNTIRLWDPASQVEVARLEGHGRLVRTIQAAFADYPGGRERLETEAAEVDRAWHIAKSHGLVSGAPQPRQGRPPRPGSRKPQDLRAVGAKIPPSGGGSKWGRIVSGSYDETVIIWKKTEDDEWVIGHRLRQEEALTAAGPPLVSRSEEARNIALQQQQRINTQQYLNAHPPALPSNHVTLAADGGPFQAQPRTPMLQAHAGSATDAPNPAQAAQPPIIPPNNTPAHGQGHGHARLHPAPPNGNGGPPNARVFKLQFDARRIICCSQDNKIVGWDFANGDEHIVACSQFFAEPQ